tara:strand:- start:548 stop:871 length:324 start_codon:yes stop_codon:yes gene_type:complete
MDNPNDNQYLEMANHAKQLIEKKEKMIEFLKSKINDFDDDLRKIEYKIKAMEHLIIFEKSQTKNKECKNLMNYLEKDIKYIYEKTDTLRREAQDEVDEELIFMIELD